MEVLSENKIENYQLTAEENKLKKIVKTETDTSGNPNYKGYKKA